MVRSFSLGRDPNSCIAHFSEPCLLSANLVMVHQRSQNLWNDWKEVAHGSTSNKGTRRSRTRSRAGNRGLLVSTKDADDGSTIIRKLFCPQCIRPLPRPLERSLNPSRPRALLVVKVVEVTSLMVTFLQFCWPQQTRSGGWEETLCGHLVHDAGQVQDESDDTWGRVGTEETEHNKASSNERFVDKKVQASTEGVES